MSKSFYAQGQRRRKASPPRKDVYTETCATANPAARDVGATGRDRIAARHRDMTRAYRVREAEAKDIPFEPGAWVKRAKERWELKKRHPEIDVHAPARPKSRAAAMVRKSQLRDPYELTEP